MKKESTLDITVMVCISWLILISTYSRIFGTIAFYAVCYVVIRESCKLLFRIVCHIRKNNF